MQRIRHPKTPKKDKTKASEENSNKQRNNFIQCPMGSRR